MAERHEGVKVLRGAGFTKPMTVKKKEIRRNINYFVRVVKFIITRTIWANFVWYVMVPLAAVVVVYKYEIVLYTKTFYLACVYYHLSMLAITAGYHRYWTHKSYSIDPKCHLLPMFFALFGSSVGMESAKDFRAIHKLHHKYCDTDRDPHNYRKNFIWAHIGWRLVKNRRTLRLVTEQEEQELKEGTSDGELISCIKYMEWQHSNNSRLYIMFGLVAPSIVAGYFWNDYIGGLIFAGIIRSAVVQQSLFSIDSLGHFLGNQPFEDKKTPKNSFIVSLLTYGEGYNNFHHQFPNDYRAGYSYYRYDPTKWFLNLCFKFKAVFGVKSLHCTNFDIIQRCVLLHQQKLIDRHRAKLNWGVPVNQLPLVSIDEFKKMVKASGRALVIIKGVVHDVTPFVHNHPGGVALIKSSVGKDATSAFNGAVYDHSNAANNLLATMRIALIRDENTNSVIRQNRTSSRVASVMSNTPLETADAA